MINYIEKLAGVLTVMLLLVFVLSSFNAVILLYLGASLFIQFGLFGVIKKEMYWSRFKKSSMVISEVFLSIY